MCSTTLWARNVSSRWLGCARGTALSTAFALPANWTRMAPPLTPPGRRLRRVTSAPTTLATSSRTSAGSSSGWVPWFIGSKGRSPSRMAGPAEQCGARPQPGDLQGVQFTDPEHEMADLRHGHGHGRLPHSDDGLSRTAATASWVLLVDSRSRWLSRPESAGVPCSAVARPSWSPSWPPPELGRGRSSTGLDWALTPIAAAPNLRR